MSYIYNYKRSAYYSDSDESYGGCECVPNPCPPKDTNYTEQQVVVFVPPPGLNPSINGFTYTLNSPLTYPTPQNDNALGLASFDSLPPYPYEWIDGLNYGVRDDLGNVTYTIYFQIGAFPSPNPTQYSFDTLWKYSTNSPPTLAGPFTDLVWNGVTRLSGAYWSMTIDLLDINDLPNLRVLFEASQPTNTEPAIDINCNPVRFGFSYAASTPPAEPIALYTRGQFNPTIDYPPKNTFQECNETLYGGIIQPSGTQILPVYSSKRFNTEYWTNEKMLSGPPAFQRVTVSVSTTNRTYYAAGYPFAFAQGVSYIPTNTGIWQDTGRTVMSTAANTEWPTVEIPYTDGPSTSWPAAGHNNDVFVEFNWPLTEPNDQEMEIRYDYLDVDLNILVSHFQKTLVVREPLGAITKQITLPLDPCWNSNINYDRPLSQVAMDDAPGFRAFPDQIFRTAGGQNLPLFTTMPPDPSVDDTALRNDIIIPVGTNPVTKWILLLRGASAPTFYIYLPVFKKGTSTEVGFEETRYKNISDDTSYAGAPRTITWSVCGEFGEGDVVNGQWNFLQSNGEQTRDLATTGGIAAWEALPEGLHYVKMNFNSMPDGTVFDSTRRAQWIESVRTQMPTNAAIGYLDGVDALPAGALSGRIDQLGNTTSLNKFTGVITFDVGDIYPGDNGRSINMYYRTSSTNMNIKPAGDTGPFRSYEAPNDNNFAVSGEIFWQVINMREFFDPATKTVQIDVDDLDKRFIGGISYLKRL